MTVQLPDTARCIRCGYLLRGLPEPVCPECGTRFDPDDETTFDDPARPKRRRPLRPLRPIGPFRLLLVCAVALWLIAARSTLHGVFFFHEVRRSDPVSWLRIAGILLVCDLILRLLALFERTGENPTLLEEFRKHRRRWRIYCVAQLVIIVTLWHPWPAALRMAFSLPAFSAAADDYLTNTNVKTTNRQIGGYHVEYIWGRGQGFVWFQLSHDGFTRYGLVRHSAASVELNRPGHVRSWITPSWCLERW